MACPEEISREIGRDLEPTNQRNAVCVSVHWQCAQEMPHGIHQTSTSRDVN